MLSILIPTYKYDVRSLVLEINRQCSDYEIDYEILVQEDGSNFFLDVNQEINSLEKCFFLVNNQNLGRGKNINSLAKRAKYDWLLIMDCDTMPTQNNFIETYINSIKNNSKVFFGGISYKNEKPKKDELLRWVYGREREALGVEIRNINPNGNALTSNLLIQKELFLLVQFNETIIKYGFEDLVFLTDLKKKGIIVKHIDNPTYHLGLETSQQFLDKTKIGLENLKTIANTLVIGGSESRLLKSYLFLKRLCFVSVIAFIFNIAKRYIERNLVSKKPSLILFDLYKLGYFCTL